MSMEKYIAEARRRAEEFKKLSGEKNQFEQTLDKKNSEAAEESVTKPEDPPADSDDGGLSSADKQKIAELISLVKEERVLVDQNGNPGPKVRIFTKPAKKSADAALGESPENVETLITSAKSLKNLSETIKRNKITLRGSAKTYSPEDLIEIIEGVYSRQKPLTFATSTFGFRSSLEKLVKNETTLDFLKSNYNKVDSILQGVTGYSDSSAYRPPSDSLRELCEWKARLKDDIKLMESQKK